MRYDPQSDPGNAPGNPEPGGSRFSDSAATDYFGTRRLITIAQVCAIVSLLIGGVLLSSIALIVAAVAFRRASSFALQHYGDMFYQALKRSAIIAIIVSVAALALNAISLAILYPVMMEMLQSGDYASLLGSSQQAAPTSPGSGASTWG